MKTRWRTGFAAMTVLVLPACFVLSCGDTEHSGDTNVGTDGGDGGATEGGTRPVGGGGTRPVGGAGGGTGGIGIGGIPMLPGISDMPKTVECGKDMCGSVSTLLPNLFIDPCCVDNQCGVSTELLSSVGFTSAQAACEAKNQAGELDETCPATEPQTLPAMGLPLTIAGFAGCCRAETGTCGVMVNDLTVVGLGLSAASPELGCVDSAPFFNGMPAAPCGAQGGSGGAPTGGAPSEGGAPTAGGAGGAGGG